ncbi:hypothetical protein LOD99_7775 [Oopsacas minuta]|uniref:Uncharacterized protein n=1 Tax=Oopsacas minuta TaxID=111878 RepID=A0AAV7JQI6_9METZ|nr:hypothetical protein LOD99_7775 [Oopsacas minuta]
MRRANNRFLKSPLARSTLPWSCQCLSLPCTRCVPVQSLCMAVNRCLLTNSLPLSVYKMCGGYLYRSLGLESPEDDKLAEAVLIVEDVLIVLAWACIGPAPIAIVCITSIFSVTLYDPISLLSPHQL